MVRLECGAYATAAEFVGESVPDGFIPNNNGFSAIIKGEGVQIRSSITTAEAKIGCESCPLSEIITKTAIGPGPSLTTLERIDEEAALRVEELFSGSFGSGCPRLDLQFHPSEEV